MLEARSDRLCEKAAKAIREDEMEPVDRKSEGAKKFDKSS
jgi:hypothetical protein